MFYSLQSFNTYTTDQQLKSISCGGPNEKIILSWCRFITIRHCRSFSKYVLKYILFNMIFFTNHSSCIGFIGLMQSNLRVGHVLQWACFSTCFFLAVQHNAYSHLPGWLLPQQEIGNCLLQNANVWSSLILSLIVAKSRSFSGRKVIQFSWNCTSPAYDHDVF